MFFTSYEDLQDQIFLSDNFNNNDNHSILSFEHFKESKSNNDSFFFNLNDFKDSPELELDELIEEKVSPIEEKVSPIEEKMNLNIVITRTKTTTGKTLLPVPYIKKGKIFGIKKEKKLLEKEKINYLIAMIIIISILNIKKMIYLLNLKEIHIINL